MGNVFDPGGRGPRESVLLARGAVAFVVVAAVVAALIAQYRGAFASSFPATAVLSDVGDGLQSGAEVRLRGAPVGAVEEVRLVAGSADGAPDGREPLDTRAEHEVELRLRPDLAGSIPAGVTARVVPTSVFGTPSVELLDPPATAGREASLPRDARIPADRSRETLLLQSTLDRVTRLLKAVQPSLVNAVLSELAAGLSGRGERVGSLVGRLDRYLGVIDAHRDDLAADLRLLGTDLDVLARIAPPLLDTVDDAVVLSRTLVEKQDRLTAALTAAGTTATDVNEFLDQASGRLLRVLDAGAALAGTLAPQRPRIPASLASLGEGAGLLGRGLSLDGGSLSLAFTATPFTPYTAADCPRYRGLAGPGCPTGGRRAPVPAAPLNPLTRLGGAAGTVGSAVERQLVDRLGAGRFGGAGDVLLGPLLRAPGPAATR